MAVLCARNKSALHLPRAALLGELFETSAPRLEPGSGTFADLANSFHGISCRSPQGFLLSCDQNHGLPCLGSLPRDAIFCKTRVALQQFPPQAQVLMRRDSRARFKKYRFQDVLHAEATCAGTHFEM
jgi:hypothetical protein